MPACYARLQETWYNDYLHIMAPELWLYENMLVKWRNFYKQYKEWKKEIKEELSGMAWHPSRRWYFCLPQDEKRDKKVEQRKVREQCTKCLCILGKY